MINVNYCILVTITADAIAFRYNRSDGDNRFVDYAPNGEVNMPFAILCTGNKFVIGRSAYEAACHNHNPNAYANIFSTCTASRTFKFADRDEPLGKLPYYAIRCYIEQILSNIFYNQTGTLESNVARLPLMFLFGPELDTNKQRFILSPFEEGGFQNMRDYNYACLLLPVVASQTPPSDRKRVSGVVLASVDGDDLLVQLYDAVRHEPLGNVVRIEGQGRDPRIGEAANHIWNCLYNYNYKKRELEEHILREAAERFLSSTAQEVNDVLRMSDGTMQDYMLRRTELDMSAASTASRMVLYQLGNELARHGLSAQQCRVVLAGRAATDYFENLFAQGRWALPITKVTAREKQMLLDRLLGEVKASGYNFGQGGTASHKPRRNPGPPPEPPAGPTGTEVPGTDDDPLLVKRYKRRVEIMVREAKAKIAAADYKAARSKIKGLLDELHNAPVHAYDAQLEELLAQIPQTAPTPKPRPAPDNTTARQPQPPAPPATPQPCAELTEREVRMRLAPLREMVKTNYKKAEAEFAYLKAQAKLIGKATLDRKMQEFAHLFAKVQTVETKTKSTGYAIPNSDKTNVKKETVAPKSKAATLLSQGRYQEARKAFAMAHDSTMSALCTKLIKYTMRVERAIKPELVSVKTTHNHTKAQAYLKDLLELHECQQQAGIDTTETDTLVEAYKKIINAR